jgi:hypothetical protein
MNTPTATIFLPYHALDDVIQRGPRASQPAATAVVPGTLYSVSDEGAIIERSTGTAWEPYSPVPSGPVVEYDFSTATTAPPATREIRFNTAHPYTAVTTIWLRVLTANGTDLRAGLAAQPAGVTLYVQQKDDATRYGKFQTTAEGVDQGDYFAFAVTWIANGAAIVNNQAVAVQFAGGGSGGGGGTGDVVGPASAVDNSVAVYSGTTGKLLKDASQVTVDAASGNITTPGSLTAGGLATTPLNASNVTSGTVADARLSSNVPLKNAVNTFTDRQEISYSVPRFDLTDISQPVDQRKFQIVNYNQKLLVQGLNDAGSVASGNVAIDRSGNFSAWTYSEYSRTTPIGHWIDVPFNAANFQGYGGETWTVAAGHVVINCYTLLGKTLIWTLSINGASLAGTAQQYLTATIPGGFTAVYESGKSLVLATDASGYGFGATVNIWNGDLTKILLTRNAANWAIGGMTVGFSIPIRLA